MGIEMLDPLFQAQCYLRKRKYDKCIALCSTLLQENPYDKAVWLLKCKAFTEQSYTDDTELEEQGIAELLLDDNAIASMPRPGTSLNANGATFENNRGVSPSQSFRPVSSSGRALTGFQRPSTNSNSGNSTSLEDAYKGNRPGTNRPVTTLGRQVRLGTASMVSEEGGPFIDVSRLNLAKYAARPSIGRALCDYLLYKEHNPAKALELAAEATQVCEYKDWWWKSRIAKCYYQLNLLRDAEKHLKSAINDQPMISLFLELGKVYVRLDQPQNALDVYTKGLDFFPAENHLLLAVARIHETMGDTAKCILACKRVLNNDPSCVEPIAILASHSFYSDQPEVALRYYQRLVQMGVNSAELWNNLALCCFHASQYDMTLSCFEKALALADDLQMADIWYNIGEVAISLADLNLAYQAFQVSINLNPEHAMSHNNLGILELRKGAMEKAKESFRLARQHGPHMYEPFFNSGLLCFKKGEIQESYQFTDVAQDLYPNEGKHSSTSILMRCLEQKLESLVSTGGY